MSEVKPPQDSQPSTGPTEVGNPNVTILPPAGKRQMIDSAVKDNLIAGEVYDRLEPNLPGNQLLREKMKVSKELNMNRTEGEAASLPEDEPASDRVGDDRESDDFLK